MHEWALGDSVIRAAEKIRTEQGLNKIGSITVVLGEVQEITPEVFIEIFEEMKRQYEGFEKTELILEREDAELRCRNCGEIFGFNRQELSFEISENIHFVPETLGFYIKCPSCKSEDFEIVKGRGVYIKEIEGFTNR